MIKEIDTTKMTEKESLAAIEEIELHGRCNSPYIVKYYDSFLDNMGRINIVMEYCSNGDLHTYLSNRTRHLSEATIWKLFIQLTMGLDHLHKMKIFHRDLKSLNVFLNTELDVKIGDLGEATFSQKNQTDGGKSRNL